MHHILTNGKARDVILGLDSTFVTSVHFQNG